jgi:hypothetical protein
MASRGLIIVYRYCGKFQVCASSATSLANIFDIMLEADLNDRTIHLLRYMCYSFFFCGGVVTYIPSYSLVNLNCNYIYWFQFLRNDYFYVLMLCTLKSVVCFSQNILAFQAPHKCVMVRSAYILFLTNNTF